MTTQTKIDYSAVAERPHAWRVTVRGDLDMHCSTSLEDVVGVVVDAGARFVLADLSEVTFLDSSGLRSIVRVSQRLSAEGGRLTITGLSGAAARVLEVTGMLEELRAGDDDDEDDDQDADADAEH